MKKFADFSGFSIGLFICTKNSFPKHLRHVQQSVLLLAIADFCSAICWMLNYSHAKCAIITPLKIFFFGLSHISTLIFAASIYVVIIDK